MGNFIRNNAPPKSKFTEKLCRASYIDDAERKRRVVKTRLVDTTVVRTAVIYATSSGASMCLKLAIVSMTVSL